VPKKKLARFAEMKTFNNVFEPTLNEVITNNFHFKNKWKTDYFKNDNPIILELGCGKGEYTIGLAEKFTDKNFLGIDIKGSRLWRGCKTAIEKDLKNVGFVRTKIDLVRSFFGENEIQDIWLTFPDPQKEKVNKRLSCAKFLNLYKNFICSDGSINLKTDSSLLYEYTLSLVLFNKLEIIANTDNLYNSNLIDEVLSIRTFYENQFLSQQKSIKYLKFRLSHKDTLIEPDY
jgi:tRNA (guanine-N7-)-methyltransferase